MDHGVGQCTVSYVRTVDHANYTVVSAIQLLGGLEGPIHGSTLCAFSRNESHPLGLIRLCGTGIRADYPKGSVRFLNFKQR